MVDKTNSESTDSIAKKSSEELFLRGSENDETLRKTANENNLKLEDSQEELFMQNIQRGSDSLEHPNKGVRHEGASAGRDEAFEVTSETIENSTQTDELQVTSSFQVNSEKIGVEEKSNNDNEQDANRVLLNEVDENGVITNPILPGDNDESKIAIAQTVDNEIPVVKGEVEETIILAPIVGDDVTLDVYEGASVVTGEMMAADADRDAFLSYKVVNGINIPDGFILNADGLYSFDPSHASYDHLNVGDSQVIMIPVSVIDDSGSTYTSHIQITVSGTNDAPVAGVSVSTSVDEGTAVISGQLTSTDLDDGATATYSVSAGSTAPDGFVINSDGSYSFDPADSSLTI